MKETSFAALPDTLKKRFTDPSYARLEDDELSQFKVYSPEDSKAKWRQKVIATDHLLKATQQDVIEGTQRLKTLKLSWDDTKQDRSRLSSVLSSIGAHEMDIVRYFWGPNHSVDVPLSLLTKYYSDFHYPSDANDAFLIERIGMRVLLIDTKLILEKF